MVDRIYGTSGTVLRNTFDGSAEEISLHESGSPLNRGAVQLKLLDGSTVEVWADGRVLITDSNNRQVVLRRIQALVSMERGTPLGVAAAG